MLKKAYKLAGTKIYQPRRLAKDQSNQAWKNNCHTLLRRHGPDWPSSQPLFLLHLHSGILLQ